MGVNRELKLLLKSWARISEETLASSEMEVELDMVADGNMEAFVLFSFTYDGNKKGSNSSIWFLLCSYLKG